MMLRHDEDDGGAKVGEQIPSLVQRSIYQMFSQCRNQDEGRDKVFRSTNKGSSFLP